MSKFIRDYTNDSSKSAYFIAYGIAIFIMLDIVVIAAGFIAMMLK